MKNIQTFNPKRQMWEKIPRGNIEQLQRCIRTLFLLLVWVITSAPTWADDIGKYELNLVAKPTIAGSFNTNSATLSAGEAVQLYAYTNSDFSFKEWVDDKGNVVSDKQNFQYNMPARSVTLTAVYTFNPANPSNPNKNYWDSITGNIIVDDFKAGSLSSAISQSIGNNTSSSKVLGITVAGKVSGNDFNIANNYAYCNTLDLSRTTGANEVPSYAFDYTRLQSVLLPSSVERIGYRAFYQCSQLSTITCYALTPPTVENYAFYGVQDGMVVFVPAAAVAQYQEAKDWKDFTILPIQNDIRTIKVSLPNDANAADYANMYLEITNTKSGQRLHYVMTGKSEYGFTNIIKNTAWNVTLRNERGDVFGEIKDVEINDEDVAVAFAELKKPQNIAIKVFDATEQDVTNQTTITWLTEDGAYLSQDNSLNGILEGSQLKYSISLSQGLAMEYSVPEQGSYQVKTADNNIICKLSTLPQIVIKGNVKDANSNVALSNAMVVVSQTFGGKYGKTINTQTDNKGNYALKAYKVPTTLTVASTDYISQSITCDSLVTNQADTLSIPSTLLRPIEGATIDVDFVYRRCTGDTEEDGTQNFYNDYKNIAYTIYNKTKQTAISNFSVQYPKIVLLDEVSVGDVLSIVATSKTDDFMPVSLNTIVEDDLSATASFEIVEKGQIQASFAKNQNANVVGSLYDAEGKLINSYAYNNALLTITNLTDGNYTLVTMGKSDLFNTIYNLNQLHNIGLSEGVDYISSNIAVKSGEISTLSIEDVPTLDESKLYYTGDNTLFAVNKSSIVVGNYLTLSAQLDFKKAYAKDVSNVNLVIDLPASCQFVENSVMVGNAIASYTYSNSQLTIPLTQYTDRVRFCVIPTLGGEYNPSALVKFDIKGKSVAQPIGTAYYNAKNLSINVPSVVAQTEIPVCGTAVGSSDIEIYDNNVLIGQTRSMANGIWTTTCTLNDAYNLSTHSIYAKVTTQAGVELCSETSDCQYDMNAIEVSKVTMLNTAHTAGNLNLYEYKTVFDFQNPQTSYSPYWYWPNYPDFTFLVDFTRNDTTVISDVELHILLSNNKVKTLKPTFDKKLNCWVATHKFGSYDLPTTVNVTFAANTKTLIDSKEIEDAEKTNIEESKKGVEEREQLIAEWNKDVELPNKELWDKLDSVLEIDNETDELEKLINQLLPNTEANECENIDSIHSEVEADIATYEESKEAQTQYYNNILDGFLTNLNEPLQKTDNNFSFSYPTYGGVTNVEHEKLSSVNEKELLDKGYEKYPRTDGSILYLYCNDSIKIFIDSKTLYRTTIRIVTDAKALAMNGKAADKASPFCVAELESAIHDLKSVFDSAKDGDSASEIIIKYLSSLISAYKSVFDAVDCTYQKNLKQIKKTVQDCYDKAVKDLQKQNSKFFQEKKQYEGHLKHLQEQRSNYNRIINNSTDKIKKLEVQLATTTDVAEKKKLLQLIDKEKDLVEFNKLTLISNKEEIKATKKNLQTVNKTLEDIKKKEKLYASGLKKTRDFLFKVPTSIPKGTSKTIKIVGATAKVVGTTVGAVIQLIPLGFDVWERTEQLKDWVSLLKSIWAKHPCKNDHERWNSLWSKSCASAYAVTAANFNLTYCDIGSMTLDFTNIPIAWAISLGADVSSWTIGFFKDKFHDKQIKNYRKALKELKCNGKNDNGNDDSNNNGNSSNDSSDDNTNRVWPLPQVSHVLDPSGYVYESVLSNRLEGVKATIYYKEQVEDMYGDLHENVVKWDAAQYAQENPLFTDENGFYRWDVPEGLWQVKFEKEGYETTYSEWLPVPPPQLDVNIGMKQNVQPYVADAKAYEDAVEVTFSKYMLPEYLNTENVMVMADGKAVDGSIELLDKENDYNNASQTYASKVRFNAAVPFDCNEVTLVVKNQVRSYANIRMENDFMQSFAVCKEVKGIQCDSLTTVEYGQSGVIDIKVLPAAAAAGKEIEVNLSSNIILSANATKCTLDENGHAQVVVNGELPGLAAVTFKLADSELTATAIVSVVQTAQQPIATPTANIATGTMVEKGTGITLSCETDGVTIYYTLDGSCPCDDTDARHIYDGTPIVINADTEIRAMAYLNGEESEVATFIYKVLVADNIDNANANGINVYPTITKGIVNVDIANNIHSSFFITDANGRQILSVNSPLTHNIVNLNGLSSGMYVVVIRTSNGQYVTKVIKL